MGLLSTEQREQYEKQGFFVVPKIFRPDELSVWIDRLRQIVEGEVEAAERMLVMRDVMIAKGAVTPGTRAEAIAKLQDYENDTVLFAYARDERLLDWVEELIGPDIKSIHTMLINKPPNVDGRHPLHQDLLYFPFRPADSIVATWTALEPVNKENGCLVVIPGSHRGELLAHENMDWEYVNRAYFGAVGVGEATQRVHLEMEPGDTVFFHPVLLHGSGRNTTQGFRRAISAHFASSQCRYLNAREDVGQYRNRRHFTLLRGREYEDAL